MKEVSKVMLINKETNKCIGKYAYEDLSLDIKLREKLNNYFKTGKYKLICCCTEEQELAFKIENSASLKVIPAHKNMGALHDKCCCKSDEFKRFKSKFISGWKKDDNSENVEATLGFSLNPKKNILEIINIPDDDCLKKNNIKYTYGHNEGKLKLSTLITRLNLNTFERILRRDNKLISDRIEFLKSVFGTSNFIKISGTDKTLKDLTFNYFNDKNIKLNESRFVYGYVSAIRKNLKDNNYLEIDLINYLGKIFTFNCTKEDYLVCKNTVKGKIKSWNDIVIAGFVFKNKGRFEFMNLTFMPINKIGLYCESSYEREFYNLLIENNIKFYKPYEHLIEYEGHIPDGIITNPNTGKTTFIEIFGFNSDEYRENMKHKMMIMENLKDTHNLLKWNALDGEQPPTIDEINKIINS